MDSTVLSCCCPRRRSAFLIVYIIVGLWTLMVVIGTLSLGSKSKEKVVTMKKLNVFDKWSKLSNQRNLLSRSMNIQPVKDISDRKHIMRDISHYFKADDEISRNKVFSALESFRYSDPKLSDLDCQKVMDGDSVAIINGKLANLQLKSVPFQKERERLLPSAEVLVEMSKQCDSFRDQREYISVPLSKEEAAFPIAFIITIHRDLPSFERLLRSIYHPQNLYCVHVDLKSEQAFKDAVDSVCQCFDNVFIATNLTSVRYTHYSRVQADINCMKDLVQRADKYPWRYVINLCGQDFPLKTNLEMVRSLKSLQGFNNLETVTTPIHKKRRYQLHFELPKNAQKGDHSLMLKTKIKKEPPPDDVEIFAGSAYYIFKRRAIEFILTDSFMQTFFKWCEDTFSPDELLWATIQRMFPQVPGSFPPHEKYDVNELNSITRIVKWGGLDKKVYPKCDGRFVRGVCVYGCGDLPWLVTQKHLFANKFDTTIDFSAVNCLENWIRNRTVEQSEQYLIQGFL